MYHKILPIEECLEYEEFTDRIELLRELETWIKNIYYKKSSSKSIISPRRLGKTVLLERLVNIVFFKPEYRVAPIYFSMGRDKTTLRDFLFQYATTFFRQYIAYCLQEPILYQKKPISLSDLAKYSSDNDDVKLAQEMIDFFLKQYETENYTSSINNWIDLIRVPENLASLSNTKVAIIIDEFQEMKFSVYETSNDKLLEYQAKGLLTDFAATDLTVSYRRQSQSRVAPMLVSGSAVTMIFKTVMGGPLGGRFDFTYVKPLSIPDGTTLLYHLITIYRPNLTILPENAFYASTQVGGHPYYLYCLVHSKYEQKFDSKESIDALIHYETTEGKIFGFWQTHFQNNGKYINEDNDQALGKKIIYHFIRYNNQPVEIEEIAGKLKVSEKAVEEKIEKLYQADLVWRTKGRFYAFNDICLMRYIKFVYEKDLKDIDKIDLSLQSKINNLKGRFLETVVQVTMMKFNHETIQGELFGKSGSIEVPLFDVVDTRQVKASKTRAYQIDVFARKADITWLCECKYTKVKMGMNQVKKIERAAEVVVSEAHEIGANIPNIQLWLVSTGGFTDSVLAYVKKREDIYYSDYESINAIFRLYGGNYQIPMFQTDRKIGKIGVAS
ncbi:ATPase domain protein, prokaryote domain protein [Candidatus Magnetomorum sp. HK-1]|nr:ATPase domain protein, prokaryote domain protein [Candidatus Magnetomorum sp. HK-1]